MSEWTTPVAGRGEFLNWFAASFHFQIIVSTAKTATITPLEWHIQVKWLKKKWMSSTKHKIVRRRRAVHERLKNYDQIQVLFVWF